jgi:Transcriptional regulator containing PAS, AAA-type ATPase, and DNA-binding domains
MNHPPNPASPFLLNDGVDLELVVRHSSDSIFVSDENGRILLLNPACQQMLGLDFDGKVEINVQSLLKDGVYEPSTALEAARRKETTTGLVRSQQGGYDIMAVSKPVFDEQGKVIMVITSSRSKKLIDEFLADALREEQVQTARYRQAASVLSDTLQHENPVAASQAMKSVLDLANSVARADATVLLTGESGTGKEVLALYIHRHSARSEEPFIPVNCGAVPPELMEAEFFGYVRGAFTGADPKGKAGLFETAHRGTLFLDEVGELPLQMQTKLLRVLENGEIQRVGGTTRHKTDVRIIAATNRNLYDMAQEGRFRMDLYYRLHVIPMTIAPLRDRVEDIEELALRFLADCNRRHTLPKTFGPGVLDVLKSYKWPGNVRELRNFIERLAVVSPGGEIEAEFCSALLFGPETTPRPKLPHPGEVQRLRAFRAQVEGEYIREVVARCDGNVQKAADLLGIHKTVLYRKLKRGG